MQIHYIWQQSFHPGVVGDLPFSLTEHNIQQQILVPSGLLPLSVILKSQKSGKNTQKQPQVLSCTRQHLRRHSCYGMTWTIWKMQSDCLPGEFLVKRSSSVYLYVVLSLENVSPSIIFTISYKSFCHFLNRYLWSSWISVFSLNQTSEGLCTSRLATSHPLFLWLRQSAAELLCSSQCQGCLICLQCELLYKLLEKVFLMERIPWAVAGW